MKLLGGHTGKLAPVQAKRLAQLIRPSNRWTAEWAGDDPRMTFQVKRGENNTVGVDLTRHS
ncbi:hypothetical protein PIB30_116229, partial [Stylosanthes scabra]|nr:hypothetical protein [Stylosanthes scabra]